MAKAQIRMPDGVVVRVDGTAEEVASILREINKNAGSEKRSRKVVGNKKRHSRVLIGDLVESLRDGGFFKKPRGLADVKTALAEMGHHYPVTTLSGAMLKEVRKKNLRRLREDKHWAYAQ